MHFDENADNIIKSLDATKNIFITGINSSILIKPDMSIISFYDTIENIKSTNKPIHIFMDDANICDHYFYSFICMAILYIPENRVFIYYNGQMLIEKGIQTNVQIQAVCPNGPLSCVDGRVKIWTFFTKDLDIILYELRKIALKTPGSSITKFIKLVQFLSDAVLILSDDIDSLQIEIIKRYSKIPFIENTTEIIPFRKLLTETGYNYFQKICDEIGVDESLQKCKKDGPFYNNTGLKCQQTLCVIPVPYKIVGTAVELQRTLNNEQDIVQTLPYEDTGIIIKQYKLKADIVEAIMLNGKEIPGLREALYKIKKADYADNAAFIREQKRLIDKWRNNIIHLPLQDELINVNNTIPFSDAIEDKLADLDREYPDLRKLLYDRIKADNAITDRAQIKFIKSWMLALSRLNLFGQGGGKHKLQYGKGIHYEYNQYGAFILLLSAQLLIRYKKIAGIKKKSLLLTGIQNFINKLFVLY